MGAQHTRMHPHRLIDGVGLVMSGVQGCRGRAVFPENQGFCQKKTAGVESHEPHTRPSVSHSDACSETCTPPATDKSVANNQKGKESGKSTGVLCSGLCYQTTAPLCGSTKRAGGAVVVLRHQQQQLAAQLPTAHAHIYPTLERCRAQLLVLLFPPVVCCRACMLVSVCRSAQIDGAVASKTHRPQIRHPTFWPKEAAPKTAGRSGRRAICRALCKNGVAGHKPSTG